MAGFPVRQYQAGGDFVVVRAMDFGPRSFKAGDDFPWREMGVHEATVQMLWKAVRIEVKRPAAGAAVAAKPSSPTTAPAPAGLTAAKPPQQNQLPRR